MLWNLRFIARVEALDLAQTLTYLRYRVSLRDALLAITINQAALFSIPQIFGPRVRDDSR